MGANLYPVSLFRVNVMIIFAFSLATVIMLHMMDRRAGGE